MKRSSLALVSGVILVIFAIKVILPVYAQDMRELENKLNKVNKEMIRTEANLKALKNQKQGVIQEKAKLDKEIDKTETELEQINQLLAQSEQKIKEKQEELLQATQKADEQFEALKLRARTMYEDGNITYMEILLNSKNFSDFISRFEIVKEIIKYDTKLLEQLRETQNSIANAKKIAEEEKKNREKLKNRVVTKKRELDQQLASRSQLIQRLTSQEQEYAKALEELEETSKQVEKELKRLQELNKRKYAGGKLAWPTPNYYNITSPFGNRFHPILKQYKLHTGIDIGAPNGAAVKAANDGKVILATWNGGYGKCVIIDHGGGIATLYAHNSTLLVSTGQEVKKGQTISKVGSTGWSTGPHLHFEVREKGTPVNPMNYYK
ncbi:MAG: hypothetical protein PWP27_1521 [Clostridiales bacterium]|jgi:murein DD-endopeptidase MepM/ murein hydrolase activator NlpD|nr:hypothetical protein [Clostridiales bacterium]MDK2933711.1 hypothetical protein [Clostridiales bacterium]